MRSNRFLLLQILLLDLIGFSLIFPLVPNLLEFYLSGAAERPLDSYLPAAVDWLARSFPAAKGGQTTVVVLFGGVLASIYSFLQFVSSAWWGRLSDRIGRRPVLVATSIGLALSYLLWAVSSSFSLFLLSRIFGGLMAGNMGVASAAMADMTPPEDRTKAMGMIGATFGVGFILGPVLGGLLSKWNPVLTFPGLPVIHPFTGCALAAALVSGLSALRNISSFQETLKPGLQASEKRWIENPFGLLRTELRYAGFAHVVLVTFFFTTLFAAFEFSITFFFKFDFGLSPMQLGLIFLYIGILIVIGQGLIVRRLSSKIHERTLALIGLASIPIPLYLFSTTAPALGLALLALLPIGLGSALVRPALGGLASLIVPADRQGLALGVVRSSESLSRAIGPLAGAYLYWVFGVEGAYLLLAFAIAGTFLFAMRLKKVERTL